MTNRYAARFAALILLALSWMAPAIAPAAADDGYSAQEIVDSGHMFFGSTSGGLATVIEKIFESYAPCLASATNPGCR